MPNNVIENVLNGKLDSALLMKWLNDESIEDAPDDCVLLCCSKSDFVAYFLTYLRNQTDSILQTNSNVQLLQNATPEKLLARKHHRSASEPTSDENTVKNDSKSHSPSHRKSHESPNRKKTGRRVKTKLFTDNSSNVSSDESRISLGVDRIQLYSTPMKNGIKPEFPITSPVTPRNNYERCDTPRFNHRPSRSHEKSCLGDYLVTATKSTKKKKKNSSNDDLEKVDLDLSNSEVFPEIGRKSTSLRSEKRRIKPTNIDKSQKSLSLSSFNTESFQSSLEENSAFKQQKIQPKESTSFEVERKMLKQERQKLMEKFNLNTPTKVAPQIRIAQKEIVEVSHSYVKVEAGKVLMRDKIDLLIELYDVLLMNNLILSIGTELYFLISILVSKQKDEEYAEVEIKLKDNNVGFLLKSIHNSTYFAVKSLWNQRNILEVILDKNSLKTLGENKKVRHFAPELAKFILNTYSVRCELPKASNSLNFEPANCENINFNCETDNADNFPNNQAFHLFKKQRDMFYDIIRWYQATQSGGHDPSRTTFRARVKALLSGGSAANHAHLASLFVAHMLASCLPNDAQESKLSKLNRRLTAPNTTDSNRLPRFTDNEIFYKEFINHAENESFRVHLKDALSTEIINLDGTHLAADDGGNSNNVDVTKEYLLLAKKLSLLAKFLGYLTSLPYTLLAGESAKSTVVNSMLNSNDQFYKAPKEKVLDNNIGLRNYSQPSIDIKELLEKSIKNNRISITLPWIANYLSMLDYTTLRINYYNDIIKKIYDIYKNIHRNRLKKNTVIYMKSILGWLFDLPHFPITSDAKTNSDGVESIDFCELVDESTILELCPCLREINTLLSTCRLNFEQKEGSSFRHITPVSLSVNNEDRIKNKEKELQTRLEEELLKSQPMSYRRALEMVVERVTSGAVRELTGADLPPARAAARAAARGALGHAHGKEIEVTMQIYLKHAAAVRSEALQKYRAPLAARCRAALAALLPAAPAQLTAVAARRAMAAFTTWLDDHTNTTALLCKDIVSETRSLIALNEMNLPSDVDGSDVTDITDGVNSDSNVSVAEPLIHLKEHICLLLDDEQTYIETSELLSVCSRTCSPANAFCRAPARKAILLLTVDLAVVYASKKPKDLNESLLNQLHEVWNTCCPDRKHHTPEDISLPERRYDISPELRNFDDEELMATPISDEEDGKADVDTQQATSTQHATSTLQATSTQQAMNVVQQATCSTQQAINVVQQATCSTQQAMNVVQLATNSTQHAMTVAQLATNATQESTSTTQQAMNAQFTINIGQAVNPIVKYQTKRVNLQPINTKSRQRNARSQPASPMLQPLTPKWVQKKSKSQPVSPKLGSNPFKMTSPSVKTNNSNQKSEEVNELLDCFNRILCPRNIVLLSESKCDKSEVWECMACLLVFLLKNDYLSEDSLTEQCLAVYRQDWPQNILENLSSCMRSVSVQWSRSFTGKFTLFLDFLAEYCGNMDYDPLE